MSTQEKIYIADHAVRDVVYGNNSRDINQVLENIVYLELFRRGYDVTVGKVREAEVDFCAAKGSERIYVQVAYLLSTEETLVREFAPLENIQDNFMKYVLSMDEVNMSRGGIRHVHISDFLLSEEW